MIYPVMFLLSLSFVAVVLFLARDVVTRLEEGIDKEVSAVKQQYTRALAKKEKILAEKKALNREAAEIFTLYEVTREIAQTGNEQQAFAVFKQKLKENVRFRDCQLLKETKDAQDSFLFPLKEKGKIVRYLAFDGLEEEDRDKAMILGHQFALALRRVRLYEAIERLATTDSLTDAYTRRYFMDRFEEEFQRAGDQKTNLSFLMIDVDHFKSFNDQYGHLSGDQILKEISYLIKQGIREIDIHGRFGGEEFCVILPDTNREGAQFVAERIRVEVETTTIKAYDTSVKATVSIGISTFPEDGREIKDLIDKADWALYRAKKQGRNRVC